MPRVVVQEEGGFAPLTEWSLGEPGAGVGVDTGDDDRWAELSDQALQRALAHDVRRALNVFLILDEEELLEARDQDDLTHLLEKVRDSSWGARTFLASSPIKESAYLRRHKTDLETWMRQAVKYRVADFLQIRDAFRSDAESLWSKLRDAAAESRQRQERLRAHHVGPWICAVPAKRGRLLVDLMKPLATNDSDRLGDSNLLILVNSNDAETQIETVQSQLESWHGRTCRVATKGVRHRATHELTAFCEECGLGEILAFDGVMQLWFWLLQSNHDAVPQASGLPFLQNLDMDREPLLIRRPPEPRPFLLLTASFDLDETDQWRFAAEEVGEMTVRLPLDLDFHVALAVTPKRLQRALEKHPEADVWIHMGHGNGMNGLWTPETGHIPPQQWAKHFVGRALRLALFLTCDSDVIARTFAAAGAELAVGFKGKVEADKTRELAIDMIKALALESSTDDAMVKALRAGALHFEATQELTATVHAYRPRRR